MGNRAELIIKNAESLLGTEQTLRHEREERERNARDQERTNQDRRKQQLIDERWVKTGILQIMMDIAELKGFRLSEVSSGKIRLVWNEWEQSGYQGGGGGCDCVEVEFVTVEDDGFLGLFRAKRSVVRVNGKIVDEDGSFDDLLADALAHPRNESDGWSG